MKESLTHRHRGTIIPDKETPVLMGLAQDGIKSMPQIVLPVTNRKPDADSRTFGLHFLSFEWERSSGKK